MNSDVSSGMKFEFRAAKEGGELVTGVREAPDRFALARELRQEGLVVISARPARAKRSRRFFGLSLAGRVRMKDRIMFAGLLSAMLKSGLSLSRALAVLERQSGSENFRRVIRGLADKISAGAGFSQSLADFPAVFPPVFAAMAGAGEESGKLAESLELVRQQLAKSYDLRRKARGAMIYPAVIVAAIIIIGILMMIFLIPTLSDLFRDLKVELPLTTRMLIGLSDFLLRYSWSALLAAFLAAIVSVRLIRTALGRRFVAAALLKLPIIGQLARGFNSAMVMRTLSSLLAAGVGMVESLAIAEKVVQSPPYQRAMKEAGALIQKGSQLSATLDERSDIFPLLVAEMVKVGEETGNLPDMLLRGAVFFEEEVEQTTKNLSTVIEPLLMIAVGAAVGFFAASVIGPIYSLTSAL